jgi:hypothetical protein
MNIERIAWASARVYFFLVVWFALATRGLDITKILPESTKEPSVVTRLKNFKTQSLKIYPLQFFENCQWHIVQTNVCIFHYDNVLQLSVSTYYLVTTICCWWHLTSLKLKSSWLESICSYAGVGFVNWSHGCVWLATRLHEFCWIWCWERFVNFLLRLLLISFYLLSLPRMCSRWSCCSF